MSSINTNTPTTGTVPTTGTSNNSGSANPTVNGTLAQTTSQTAQDAQLLGGNFNDFLQMFIAQIKNQDPLAPMTATDFTNSLAALSSVEQGVNTNTNLENITSLLQNNSNFGSPVSYLGKEVQYQSSQITSDGTDPVQFFYNLSASPSSPINVVVTDQSGNTVYSGTGTTTVGLNTMVWDGQDSVGNTVAAGNYNVAVSYVDSKSGQTVQVPTSSMGIVNEASFQNGQVELLVNGNTIPTSSVLAVINTQNSGTSTSSSSNPLSSLLGN